MLQDLKCFYVLRPVWRKISTLVLVICWQLWDQRSLQSVRCSSPVCCVAALVVAKQGTWHLLPRLKRWCVEWRVNCQPVSLLMVILFCFLWMTQFEYVLSGR